MVYFSKNPQANVHNSFLSISKTYNYNAILLFYDSFLI